MTTYRHTPGLCIASRGKKAWSLADTTCISQRALRQCWWQLSYALTTFPRNSIMYMYIHSGIRTIHRYRQSLLTLNYCRLYSYTSWNDCLPITRGNITFFAAVHKMQRLERHQNKHKIQCSAWDNLLYSVRWLYGLNGSSIWDGSRGS